MTKYKLTKEREENKRRMIEGGIMGPLHALLRYDILDDDKYRAQIDEEHPTLKNDPVLHTDAVLELTKREIRDRESEIMKLVEKHAMPYLEYDYEVPYFGPCLQELNAAHSRQDWEKMRQELHGLCYLIEWH